MPIQNKRILSILKILNKHKKAISGENLANLIGVSRSTIRRDIKDLRIVLVKIFTCKKSSTRVHF